MKISLDVNLFGKWKDAGDEMSAEQLSRLTNVELSLMCMSNRSREAIVRLILIQDMKAAILKHMASTHIINEVGPGVYSQTLVSLGFTKPELAAAVHFQFVSRSRRYVSALA